MIVYNILVLSTKANGLYVLFILLGS